jgi:hypothetical protein
MTGEASRTYWGLVAVMFQGAFSDNIYRFILAMMLLDVATKTTTSLTEANAVGASYQMAINLAIALPWILRAGPSCWKSRSWPWPSACSPPRSPPSASSSSS